MSSLKIMFSNQTVKNGLNSINSKKIHDYRLFFLNNSWKSGDSYKKGYSFVDTNNVRVQ